MKSSKKEKISVRFEPAGVEIQVEPPISVMMAAAEAGIALEHPCGGLGVCGKCVVKLLKGRAEHSHADHAMLSPEEIEERYYLSCQTNLYEDTVVEYTAGHESEAGLVLIDGVSAPIELLPRLVRVQVEIPPPSLSDLRDDSTRLMDALSKKKYQTNRIRFPLLQKLPDILRSNKWNVSVICQDDEIIDVRAYDDSRKILGAAVDLGTTTVVVSIVDLESGEELAKRGGANEQLVYGPDVLSRVNLTITEINGSELLQQKIMQTVDRMIRDMLDELGDISPDVLLVQAVGNTIMQQLFTRIDPAPIAHSPFVPAIKSSMDLKTGETGLSTVPYADVHLAPVIASYVGGDIVADILASGLHEARYPSLLVDIGTNAEIVLGCRDRLMACSSPAGPAFEGGHIFHGMRGVPGAIESVWMDEEDFHVSTIGKRKAEGICGSGLIDALSVLLKTGVVDETGRLLSKQDFPGPDWIRERLEPFKKGNGFFLTQGKKGPIHITDKDIRALQLAKGAVQAGIRILLDEWKIELKEIDQIFICGAFGSKISPQSSQHVGLIPPIPLERVRFLGNTAHIGAKRMLLSQKEWDLGVFISEKVCYFELSGLLAFQDLFGTSLGFGNDWNLL